ncbi:MAG: type IV pilus assembly protein PilM [Candidatus Omnitrophica bacterium]|nr:type IV pilus assembly protein PilM [Candidatus Omnitrophota bacterium]
MPIPFITARSISKAGGVVLKKLSDLVRPQTVQYSTGLHIGAQHIILSELQFENGETTLLRLAHESAGSTQDENVPILSGLFSNPDFSFQKVAVSVSREAAAVRIITFPRMDPKQLRASLEFEAEKYVPYNLSEIYFDCQALPDENPSSRQMKVLLAACKRDVIMNLIQTVQKAKGQIDVINLDSLAILNSFLMSRVKKPAELAALLDIGTRISNLSIIENNKVVFLRDISFGGADLTQALVKSMQISSEEAENAQKGVEAQSEPYVNYLRPVLEKIAHEVKITIHYVEGQIGKALNLKKLYLAGGMTKNILFHQCLKDFLELEPVVWNPLENIKIGNEINTDLVKELETVLPVSLGLALG